MKTSVFQVCNAIQKGFENPEFYKVTRVQDPIVPTKNRSHWSLSISKYKGSEMEFLDTILQKTRFFCSMLFTIPSGVF